MEEKSTGGKTKSMIRIYLLVEGQTEETFVRDLLEPYYRGRGMYLTPIIVRTSAGHKGGVVNYAKVKPQIERLCKQDTSAYVSTMFDLYALPHDFPGKDQEDYFKLGKGRQKAEFVEMALAQNINQPNFIPNLLVHEYEALLFTNLDAFETWTDDDSVLQPLRNIRERMEPEDINDSVHTAPSKRILNVMSAYQKTLHGPLIACDIGLDAIRAACPHFNAWLERLEALINNAK